MRLDGKRTVVAAGQQVLNHRPHRALALTRHGVVGVLARRVPARVLDVDVKDVRLHLGIELPGVLLGPRLGLRAVGVEDGIGRVENQLETGRLLQQFQRVLPAHAAVVHAVLMDGLEAGMEKHLRDLAHAGENLGGNGCFVIARLEAHHPHVFCAEPFHARDAAAHLGQRYLEGRLHRLGPVHDRGAKAVHAQIGGLQFLHGDLESGVGQVMEVGLGIAGHFHATQLDPFPAELLMGFDLSVNGTCRLVANACENHKKIPEWIESSRRQNYFAIRTPALASGPEPPAGKAHQQ